MQMGIYYAKGKESSKHMIMLAQANVKITIVL